MVIMMSTKTTGAIVLAICIVIFLLWAILKCPFSYPYFIHKYDVTGKHDPNIDDFLDMFLISKGFKKIQVHQEKIEQWKQDCHRRIEKSILKKYRYKQYNKILDDKEAFRFHFIRYQTRYRQKNYVKKAYKVKIEDKVFSYDFDYIKERYEQLEDINFECTLRMYHSKDQRRLATRELREKIMKRDNYTCQLCGKHMPDEVGLQVDHIILVAKGGKTVESNLRVLCSKCNASRSDKLPDQFEKSINKSNFKSNRLL